MNIQTITNVADLVPLYLPQSLYLKPLAKINISVSLPANKMGKSISNLDIMDKLTNALKPDKFLLLKVVKSTVEFIRFEAEMDERSKLKTAISRLDGISLKVNGFSSSFKVRAQESKDDFPTRHDWDAFFRDATHMDEMKAGERPDTIHFSNLPIRWFCPRHMENNDNVKPSENIFKRIFEKFGSVRYVDIPICDTYRSKMNSDINGMKTFGVDQDFFFEGYVQFEEYVGFVRAMDEFRGMKLVRKFVDKTQAINISVTFDKNKHLSDANIQRRDRVRKRLMNKAQAEKDEEERLKVAEKEKIENERKKQELLKIEELERQRQREEKRKEKRIKKMQERGQLEISHKIRLEEKKLLIAQRKLESIRILGELFSRLKFKKVLKIKSPNNLETTDLRDKLVEKYKSATEKLLKKQKEKLQEIKDKTSIVTLVHKMRKKESSNSRKSECSNGSTSFDDNSADENEKISNRKQKQSGLSSDSSPEADARPVDSNMAMNPFKMSMFPYVSPVFPGMSVFRPNMVPHMFPMSMYRPNYGHQGYRGYAPRNRGRGRGVGYEMYSSQTSSHAYHKNYRRDTESRYSRSRSRHSRSSSRHSRSRSRYSRSRSRKKYHFKRARSKDRSRKRRSHSRSTRTSSRSSKSRSRSWSSKSSTRHTRSRSRRSRNSKTKRESERRSHSKSTRTKRLVSTRRSYSSSRRSNSAARSGRSWSRRSIENNQRQVSSSKHKSGTDHQFRSRKKNYNTSEDDADLSRRLKPKKSAYENKDDSKIRRGSSNAFHRSQSDDKSTPVESENKIQADERAISGLHINSS